MHGEVISAPRKRRHLSEEATAPNVGSKTIPAGPGSFALGIGRDGGAELLDVCPFCQIPSVWRRLDRFFDVVSGQIQRDG